MQREAMWSAWEGAGTEQLLLTLGDGGAIADGLIVGVAEKNRPFRVRYEVSCDVGWNARVVRVSAPGLEPAAPVIELLADGKGNWTTSSGKSLPGLKGCLDVDISATPFTNTLPIRRLGLAPGQSAELQVVYVDVGEMRAWMEEQRYTRLKLDSGEEFYKYESLDGGFTANLAVDTDGLVLDYPGLFRRVLL